MDGCCRAWEREGEGEVGSYLGCEGIGGLAAGRLKGDWGFLGCGGEEGEVGSLVVAM